MTLSEIDMATKAQAIATLKTLGFELDPDTGRVGDEWHGNIDCIGRKCVSGDCGGRAIFNYTCTAAEFWDEVIQEAHEMSPYLEPCPHAEGECDFHDQ
jgi:hypothetical protein